MQQDLGAEYQIECVPPCRAELPLSPQPWESSANFGGSLVAPQFYYCFLPCPVLRLLRHRPLGTPVVTELAWGLRFHSVIPRLSQAIARPGVETVNARRPRGALSALLTAPQGWQLLSCCWWWCRVAWSNFLRSPILTISLADRCLGLGKSPSALGSSLSSSHLRSGFNALPWCKPWNSIGKTGESEGADSLWVWGPFRFKSIIMATPYVLQNHNDPYLKFLNWFVATLSSYLTESVWISLRTQSKKKTELVENQLQQ